MTGDPLPDEDHVARYFKPSSGDEHLAVAVELKALLSTEAVYPAIPQPY